MTPAQKVLVQTTFAKLVPIADQAAALFYGRLFAAAPALRPLFKTDLGEQGRKLMQMIGVCVKGLDALDRMTEVLTPGGEAVKPLDSIMSFDTPPPAESTDGEGVAVAG